MKDMTVYEYLRWLKIPKRFLTELVVSEWVYTTRYLFDKRSNEEIILSIYKEIYG